MLSKRMQDALNAQVLMEAQSSQAYLAMGSWAEIQPGLKGVTQFFFRHSEEERMHMLKLIHYINERGGFAVIPALEKPVLTFVSLKSAFDQLFKHEVKVSESINHLVEIAREVGADETESGADDAFGRVAGRRHAQAAKLEKS